MTDQAHVWRPDEERARRSHMARFIRQNPSLPAGDCRLLYQWSIDEPQAFWAAVAEFCEVRFGSPPDSIMRQPGDMRTACWFEGAKLNFAANLLGGDGKDKVLVCVDERGRRRTLNRAQLIAEVASVAAAMRQVGISPGDRVAAMLPNCAEAVIAMLAAASIGAVFSSCSPDFGVTAVKDRFGQIEPRVMFVCDGYSYAGRRIDCLDKVDELATALPSLEKVIVVPFLDDRPDTRDIPNAILYSDFCVPGSEPAYESLPFNHPLLIVYSSGTTGRPKCILHGAGGTLLQHKKELMLHTDIHPEDVVFYFTTCGWMMWNWLVSALSVGATVVLYDGAPTHPHTASLLQIAADERVTVFGTSPRYLTMLEKDGATRIPERLPALRSILSTGAPLAADSYDFVRDTFGEHIQLCSISGGTDLISCFALGNPLLPVYRGELQCRGLGMAVEIYDEEGRSIEEQPGELVCTRPFPSMPLGFWNDNGEAYEAAYFKRFPGVWAHGDFAETTAHGGLIIHGRADAVVNPGGVRIGTAEICEPATSVSEVLEAIAVGQRAGSDERVILFVVLREDATLDESLCSKIRAAISSASSPRHVPSEILDVPEIPRTISGKPVELAVRATIHGEPLPNLAALANPASLEFFKNRI